ncbi:MAG: sodium:calcium antiporter, partial [Chloroflexota bacterium]
MLDFSGLALWQNAIVFAVAAAVIWIAGSRLTLYADAIVENTQLGAAFVGVVFLAVATSLPEIGRTITAAAIGNAPLAVDSLFGGVVLQTAVLAIADLTVTSRPLTFFAPQPVLLLQGVVVVLLLGLALAGIAAGELAHIFNVGLWTIALAGAYGYFLYALRHYEARERWRPVDVPDELRERGGAPGGGRAVIPGHRPLRSVAIRFGISSAIIFAAGVLLAEVGNALAGQTGLGSGFIGATLLAFASALPEMSTTIAAVRIGAYSLAVANIFGANAFLVALLLLADVFYR